MKYKKTLFSVCSLILTLTICLTFFGKGSALGSARLYITPSSGTYKIGDTITFAVHEDSGSDGVNSVEADLIYNTGILGYQSSANSSNFSFLDVPRNPSPGLVSFVSFVTSGERTGDKQIGTVTFKALAAGTANLSFATNIGSSGSAIIKASDHSNIWNGQTAAASITISSQTSTGTPTNTGSTTTTTTTNNSSTSTTTNTTKPATSTPTNTTPTTNNTSAPSGVQGASSTGYLLAIKVLDENNKIVVGVKVTIDGNLTVVSDASGIANFINVPAGKHKIESVIKGKKSTQVIEVKGVSSKAPQQFSVQPSNKAPINKTLYIVIGVAVFGLIILILIIRKLRTPPDGHHFDGAPIMTGPAGGPDPTTTPSPSPTITNEPQSIGTVVGPTMIVREDTPDQNNTSTGAL